MWHLAFDSVYFDDSRIYWQTFLQIWPLCSRLFAEKPSIDLSRVKDITVRAGENIKIALPLKGWPVPSASWQRGDQDIYKDDRNNIEVSVTSR